MGELAVRWKGGWKRVEIGVVHVISLIMKTLLIRDVPDEVHDVLVFEADRSRRSKEKQALYLIESGLSRRGAETCGELLDSMESEPAPEISETDINTYMAARGRRSHRP